MLYIIKTGKPIPQELINKINNASKFNTGFSTVEALSSALIDMKLHLAGSTKIDPKTFEKETLAALKMPKEMVMRHRMPAFGHISLAMAILLDITVTAGVMY